MPRNPVRVAVRTRPTSSFASNLIEIDPDSNVVVLHNESTEDESTPFNNQNLTHHFHYHQVFLNANQDDVYDASAREIVQNTIYGSNGAIIAYGQTGSGKTFTMIGDTKNYEHRGIAPRAISHLFAEIHARSEIEYKVVISSMEIYNERIYDLLADFSESARKGSQEYTILEDRHGKGVYVRGLTEVEVQTEEEALNLLFSGELSKTTARHLLNRRSNRSHSIFTVTLYQKPKSGVSEKTVISKLNLVDLAGSERLKKTLNRQEQMAGGTVDSMADEVIKKESRSINQSLSYLEQCILALSSKQPSAHIPYRQTKLTNILKDSIGGNCNTLFMTCIYAEQAHLEETLSSLRMAQRMMRVENETHAVESVDTSKLLKKYEMTIKELRQELLMIHSFHKEQGAVDSEEKSVGELSTSSINYSEYSEEEKAKLRLGLQSFVKAPVELEDDEMPRLESIRQMKEMLKIMKRMVLEEASRADELDMQLQESFSANPTQAQNQNVFEPFDSSADFPQDGLDFVSPQDRVGELTEGPGAGISLGQSYSNPPPPQSREDARRQLDGEEKHKEGGEGDFGYERKDESFLPTSSQTYHQQQQSGSSDREVLFSKFKSGRKGGSMNQEFMALKRSFKNQKAGYNRQRRKVNGLSEDIQAMQQELAKMKAERVRILRTQGIAEEEVENMVDEDEFELMKRSKEAKRTYRRLFGKLEEQKRELESFSEQVETARRSLLDAFDDWVQKYLSKGLGTDFDEEVGEDMEEEEGGGERMDDQEAFEQMERAAVMSQDPASMAFFLAKKTQKANKTQHGVDLRQMHRTKRFG
jgi:kinesin family protein 6/9